MLNGNERIIKHKVGLLNLAAELGNVSKACQIMGVSRDTFYRYKDVVDDGGAEALMDKDRRKPKLRNRVDEQTEGAVLPGLQQRRSVRDLLAAPVAVQSNEVLTSA